MSCTRRLLPFLACGGCRIHRNGVSNKKKDLEQPLKNWQVCFRLDWTVSCLGVTAKLAVPKFAAAEKTVVRPGSGVRLRLTRGKGDSGYG